MKKRSLLFIILICQLTFSNNTAFADSTSIKVFVDSTQLEFDAQPFISSGRVLVPFRAIIEALGSRVEWDGTTRTVTASKGDKIIIIQIGSKIASVDGNNIAIDVPATIIEGRSFVPLRFISESLGAEVKWDGSTKTVNIKSIQSNQNTTTANSIFIRKMSDKRFSLIDNRLFISMPEGSKDEAILNGIMEAASSNHEETRIILEESDQKLVVYAKEMFLYSSENIEDDAKELFGISSMQDQINYTFSIIKPGTDFSVLKVIPEKFDLNSSAVLVRGALVRNSDNTLIFVGVYATPETFTSKDDCIRLSEDILNTIEEGVRKINTSAHKEKIEEFIDISLEKDYVFIQQTGIDFTVYTVIKIVSVYDIQPSMGIYVGAHPAPIHQRKRIPKDALKTSDGIIMGTNVEWLHYNPDSDTVNSSSFTETLLSTNGPMMMHIFIYPTNESDLNEMKRIAESLEIAK